VNVRLFGCQSCLLWAFKIFYLKKTKMKIQILSALVCSAIFALSCKKDKTQPTATLADVFVAGTEADNNTGKDISTVWQNGVINSQATSTNQTYARAVCVDGSDVYTTGYENDGVWKWKVWKNGDVLYTFSEGEPTDGNAIAVAGGDVYTAGHLYLQSIGKHYAIAFKNQQPLYVLTDGNAQAEGTGIAISGSDVYVAGYYGTETRLWKNGVMETLNNASGYRGVAVTIKGTDVYVLGHSYTLPLKTRVWKNGVSTDIASGSGDAFGKSIAIADNNDVYIAGYEMLNGKAAARVWKNGTPATLNDGTKHAFANAIAIKGNDVYVAGEERDANNSREFATIWKNGTQTSLSVNNSRALGIFVK
jgi:hypothetical protein